LQGHAGDLTDVRFAIREANDAPRRLWSTSLDGAIRFWAITESNSKYAVRPMLTLRGHERGVLSLAALPGGEVVSGGSDGRVILWPLAAPNH
jgi:WD40 repeat protein